MEGLELVEKMTRLGHELLTKRLDYLVKVKRGRLEEEIKEARRFCDFSEDVSFKQLVDDRLNLDQEIRRLGGILSEVEILDSKTLDPLTLSFGHKVTLIDRVSGKEESFTIGHPAESYVREDILSAEAPLARELVGRKVGDVVSLDQSGESFQIIDIS